MSAVSRPYEPDPAFQALYTAFTSDPESIGAHLAERMADLRTDDPCIVATGTDVALFPAAGHAAQVEGFRRSTRGFIEITAISHLGTAVPWLARMRELDDPGWRSDAERLLVRIDGVRAATSVDYWRDLKVAAWSGLEDKISALVDYTCDVTAEYVRAALVDETLLDFSNVRLRFLDPVGAADVPIPMNDMMAATFALAFLDIAHRFIAWLSPQAVNWERMMVLVAGRSGRATAGVTWATNNMCHLLWRISGERLDPEHVLIAPFAPSFAVDELTGAHQLSDLEKTYRELWARTRVSTELGRAMFEGYPGYRVSVPVAPIVEAHTTMVDGLPALASPHDRRGMITRLRVVMEDPAQLVSNAAAHYIIDELCARGNRAADVFIPGFTDLTYPSHRESRVQA